MADLEAIASRIPSMGGTKIGALLRAYSRDAPSGTSIVEVGTWLGAGTAQLALGVAERGPGRAIPIHCFDRFVANGSEAAKAAKASVSLVDGQDTLPLVERTLAPFSVPIIFHKGSLSDARWDGSSISVYVDDAAKDPKMFERMMHVFSPFWIPGTTILVLMDFLYWQKTNNQKHKCQKQFVERNPNSFDEIARPRGTSCVCFLYKSKLSTL